MAETIALSFTKVGPTFSLTPVTPASLPISMSEAIQGASGTIGNPEDIEGFATDPTFYYILAST